MLGIISLTSLNTCAFAVTQRSDAIIMAHRTFLIKFMVVKSINRLTKKYGGWNKTGD
jgi:hypothetical protein